MNEICPVRLSFHKPTKLPNRGCRYFGWCWCRLGPWRQKRRPWSWRNCRSCEEQKDLEIFQMDQEPFILYLLQHVLRRRYFFFLMYCRFLLLPNTSFFPVAHFGLHSSDNCAPQQQVFPHFLPRQRRHEGATESRIAPVCTSVQVFNLCASALQRTQIRTSGGREGGLGGEGKMIIAADQRGRQRFRGLRLHRSDTASDMFWITIKRRQSLARTPGGGSSNWITFCACYILMNECLLD